MRVCLWDKCQGISDVFMFDMIHDQSVQMLGGSSIRYPICSSILFLNKRYSGDLFILL